jgi:amino acid transporter
MILAYALTSGDANRYFSAVLDLSISTTTISYLFVFPAVIKLRYSHPNAPRAYRIPGGNAGAWICGGLTTFWALLASIVLLWPGLGTGWFGTSGNPDDALIGLYFKGQRLQYEISQFVPLLVFIAVGVVFYVLGSETREEVAGASLGEIVEGAPVAPA